MLNLQLLFFMDHRFKTLYRPFADEPYSNSYLYFKISYALACLGDLHIEKDETLVSVNNVRMEIYGLVVYVHHRLRGGRARPCNYETVFERYRLKRLSLL